MSSTTKTLIRILALASASALLLGACGGIEPVDEDQAGVQKKSLGNLGPVEREGPEPGDGGDDDPVTCPTGGRSIGPKPDPLWTLNHCDMDPNTCVDTCYFDGGYCENQYWQMMTFDGSRGSCGAMLVASECYEYCDY